MSALLPDGLDQSTWKQALRALEAAVGSAGLTTEPAELREYRDPYGAQGGDEFDASAVVLPATVEQVQAVVRAANEFHFPLWTFGCGRNYAYGGPAPRVRGSVLVNLRRMNRVLEVDSALAYALVEPGVQFFDLHDHLQAGGHRLWPSLPDVGWGSVIGNSLEYGRGYTPYGDHASSACGMEVVLPDGDVLRTGMGAMTHSRSWQLYPHSYGPSLDGLFRQSNLGIVTKMGVWLMPEPEHYLSGWARISDTAAIAPVVDALRALMLEGIIRNCPILGRGLGVGYGKADWQSHRSDWGLRFALYGRRELVEAQFAIVRKALTATPGVSVDFRAFAGCDRLKADQTDDMIQSGVPSLEAFDRFKPYGEHTGHVDLVPVVPFTGEEISASIRRMDALCARYGDDCHATGILVMGRSAIHATMRFFDTSDPGATADAYAAHATMATALAKEGYPFYRANLRHMDLIADQYDFNSHVQRRITERLKDVLDPGGILSPGKQGIWPRRPRG
ncbi:FAD-binding oxidoreductase [Streptomyces sp. NPDC091292]|uniref:FAD-binding oxidoreductase n=1 Tax=Streptomyces sp. NPDC091292 TaxID=3365991 RepID=UPI00382F4CDF